MRKIFLLIFCFVLFSSANTAQRGGYNLKDYAPSNVGDEWRYKNLVKDGLSPIVVKVSSKAEWRGRDVVRRDESDGNYRLQFIDAVKGLSIAQLTFDGDKIIEYEKEARLLPLRFQLGQIYRSEIFYTYKEKGAIKDTGIQSYTVTVEAIEDVQTPLKLFAGCLLIRTRALRVDRNSSEQNGYELKEWYAPNVGVVKIIGEIFRKNNKGETVETLKVNAELESATINGQIVTTETNQTTN